MDTDESRRRVLLLSGGALAAAGGAAVLASCGGAESGSKEVLAAEDLMREHGVLRRALLVYLEAADRLRGGGQVSATALAQTAALFRSFGEDYHERRLEEAFVFPRVEKAGGAAAALPAALKAQHARGREITDYVTAVTGSGSIASANSAPLAQTLQGFVRMYQWHAALEDTLVFPAWKAALSPHEYEDLSDRFEDLEKQMFGKDGYEDAVARIGAIERAFGVGDLSLETPPPPPKPAA